MIASGTAIGGGSAGCFFDGPARRHEPACEKSFTFMMVKWFAIAVNPVFSALPELSLSY